MLLVGDNGLGELAPSCPLDELIETLRNFLCLDEVTFLPPPCPRCFRLFFRTMTPLANFSSLDSLGGGGGDLKYTSRSILGGKVGLSNCVADGIHHIRILENFIGTVLRIAVWKQRKQ